MSHQGFASTFKEFKDSFYQRIGDGSLFDVAGINLLKVALDGLKVKYLSRGPIAHFFDRPIAVFHGYMMARALKHVFRKKSVTENTNNKILLGFSSRTIEEDGKNYPVYFQKLFNEYGRNKFYFISEDKVKLSPDLEMAQLSPGFSFLKQDNRKFYKQLRSWCSTLDSRWNEEEKINIRIAVYLFYIDYLKWDAFLSATSFKSALITQSYHREGFILACKKHKLIVNELQHGLIAKEDIFYVMPQQVSEIIPRAMFPDSIIVYGNYWKEILLNGCEYKKDSITVGGYFHYESVKGELPVELQNNKKVILVTTQYSIHAYFVQYIQTLAPKLTDEWMIVLKSHPSEKSDLYSSLTRFKNVFVATGNLDPLLKRSECIITIFSTTIFDALRNGKPSFSINFPLFTDYTRSLAESGLIVSVEPDENPVERLEKAREKLNHSDYFYSQFNKTVFDSILS